MAGNQKLPAMQWYTGDWRKDLRVQSLDYESRGIWFELLNFMWESESRGKLVLNDRAMDNDEIATLLGLNAAKVEQTLSKLLSKGVASREEHTGIIYNRRMVRDQHLREVRAEAGAAGGKQTASKLAANGQQKPTPSSSSSPSGDKTSPPNPLNEGGVRPHQKRKRPEPREAEQYRPEWANELWGGYKKFIALYNELGPKEWPLVKIASDRLVIRIQDYMKQFPQQEFWETVFRNAAVSKFCREYHNGGLAWLLQLGKDDRLENCVKVFEIKFDRRPALVS